MKRTATIALAIALAVALVAMPLGAASVVADGQADERTDETESIAPGEQLSGVVGVQEAETQGELTERTYGIKIANAQSDEQVADVVDEQVTDVEDRFADLEERLENVTDAREAGEISEGQYRAEVATIAAERATVERQAEAAEATAGELPEDVLEERGIDVAAIEELRTSAAELGGQDVAEIAQSIAGDAVGQSPAPDREPGAPIDTPNADRTDEIGEQDEDDSDAGNESQSDQ